MIGVTELLTGLGAILGMLIGFLFGSRYGCFAGIGLGLAGAIPGAIAGFLFAAALDLIGELGRRLTDRWPWLAWPLIILLAIAALLGQILASKYLGSFIASMARESVGIK